MAHRWNAPKVPESDVKWGQWDLTRSDMLPDFLASLPEPISLTAEHVVNPKGQPAELHKLVYGTPSGNNPILHHGTWHGALRSILTSGFEESCDRRVHEFTDPGVYCLQEISLEEYAIPTKMKVKGREHDWSLPYCRFMFRVEAVKPPRNIRDGKSGWRQWVMASDSLRVLELHVYRGWSLYHRGEKCIHLTAEDLAAMRQPRATPPPPASSAEPAAPPPPPIVWQQYICIAPGVAARAYYHNKATGATTWEEPQVPYYVAEALPSVEPWTPNSWISGTHHRPEADCDRRPSVQPW